MHVFRLNWRLGCCILRVHVSVFVVVVYVYAASAVGPGSFVYSVYRVVVYTCMFLSALAQIRLGPGWVRMCLWFCGVRAYFCKLWHVCICEVGVCILCASIICKKHISKKGNWTSPVIACARAFVYDFVVCVHIYFYMILLYMCIYLFLYDSVVCVYI